MWESNILNARREGTGRKLYTEIRSLPNHDPQTKVLRGRIQEIYAAAAEKMDPAFQVTLRKAAATGSGKAGNSGKFLRKTASDGSSLPESLTSSILARSQTSEPVRTTQERAPTDTAGRPSQSTNCTSDASVIDPDVSLRVDDVQASQPAELEVPLGARTNYKGNAR